MCCFVKNKINMTILEIEYYKGDALPKFVDFGKE